MKQRLDVKLAQKLVEREQENEKLKSDLRVLNEALALSQRNEALALDELAARRLTQGALHAKANEVVGRFKRELSELSLVVETLK